MAARMKMYLLKCLRELTARKPNELLDARYDKFRKMGVYLESGAAEGDAADGDAQIVSGAVNGHA